MTFVTALVVAVAIHTVVGSIKTPLASAPISDRNITRISSNSTSREPNGLHPTVAFWDDDYAAEEDWNKNAAKGGALICGLEGSDQTAGRQMKDTREPPSAARPYNSDLKIELQDWVEHWDPEKRDNEGNQIPAINQWYSTALNNKQYRATKAHFEFGINTKGGAIYGLFLESPQASAKTIWGGGTKEPNKDDLPQLRAFSDIIWGFWVRNNPNIKNIRYFFMIAISNEVTNQIIASCLRDRSPNGAGFAYFLMQHKLQLGQKTISKITIFRPETDDDVSLVDASLCFHVVDGPQPPPDDAHMEGTDRLKARLVQETNSKDSSPNSLVRVHEIYM
ncbi:uncharacterized protein J4E92_005934 [Alternaria infectoria]|uniref:uncharacterized protein n=1 Tax=Alternaria infectoria TaxID=45303 RepID=UPI00221FD22A|nr:uncharacterized protein J4E92_005934 [Alternaria infectoria]KAI4928448.1 hypothetical protein J4E92_005934 [Alternaria infectoria]